MAHEPRQHCLDTGLEVAKTLNLLCGGSLWARHSLIGEVFGSAQAVNHVCAALGVVSVVELAASAVARASDGRSVTLQPAAERVG